MHALGDFHFIAPLQPLVFAAITSFQRIRQVRDKDILVRSIQPMDAQVAEIRPRENMSWMS